MVLYRYRRSSRHYNENLNKNHDYFAVIYSCIDNFNDSLAWNEISNKIIAKI